MITEGLILGGSFYLVWKGGVELYRRHRLRVLEKDLVAVEAALEELRRFELRTKTDVEDRRQRQKEHKAFYSDLERMSNKALPEEKRYAATPYGFLIKEDALALIEAYPRMNIQIDNWSSPMRQVSYGAHTTEGTTEFISASNLRVTYPNSSPYLEGLKAKYDAKYFIEK